MPDFAIRKQWLAENAQATYEAYVSEQNLLADDSRTPCRHPMVEVMFEGPVDGVYSIRRGARH